MLNNIYINKYKNKINIIYLIIISIIRQFNNNERRCIMK